MSLLASVINLILGPSLTVFIVLIKKVINKGTRRIKITSFIFSFIIFFSKKIFNGIKENKKNKTNLDCSKIIMVLIIKQLK